MPLIQPKWSSILYSSLASVPRTAYRTARRVVKDIGSNDPKLAGQALRMVGMHAAGGAAVGGIYSVATGGDLGRGALYGGLAGAGFGLSGGVGLANQAYKQGMFHATRKTMLGSGRGRTMSRLSTLASNARSPYVRNRAQGRANMISAEVFGVSTRAAAGADLTKRFGAFKSLHNKAMGGYNPFG